MKIYDCYFHRKNFYIFNDSASSRSKELFVNLFHGIVFMKLSLF